MIRRVPDISIFRRDGRPKPVQARFHRNLAGEPRIRIAVGAAVEQVVLVLAHRRQLVCPSLVDKDMAGGARAAAAAKREQFVKACVADHLHHRRSEEHTSELQSLMRTSYAVVCLKKNTTNRTTN